MYCHDAYYHRAPAASPFAPSPRCHVGPSRATATLRAGESAVKLLDRTGDRRKLAVVNQDNELKVVDTRSKELVFSVLTRRPFLMNELQLWDEGVATISRHLHTIDGAVRESTRDAVVRHRSSTSRSL